MRKILILVFANLAFITLCMGQQNVDSLDVRIKVLIDKTKNKVISKSEKDELIGYVFMIQNKGFSLQEKQGDYANSLIQIQKALTIWEAIGDTLCIANLLKYDAVLYGKLKQFDKGKRDVNKAISLYKSKQVDGGVAISYHDLSLLYDQESKIDSALICEIKDAEFWKKEPDTLRIVVSNNQLIHLYQKQKKFDIATKIQNQNDLMVKPATLAWNPLINFYFVSYELYNSMKNDKLAKKYKDLYTATLSDLKKEQLFVKSMYEE